MAANDADDNGDDGTRAASTRARAYAALFLHRRHQCGLKSSGALVLAAACAERLAPMTAQFDGGASASRRRERFLARRSLETRVSRDKNA